MSQAPPTANLNAIDLNLLVVFDAVMQERSVTRAGERLGLSQPAMSHALSRLRHMLKDDLFIRSPKGMLPTPRAEQLAIPVRTALDGLQQSLEPDQFDPSKATRKFRLAVDNYAAVVLVGPLAERIVNAAPGLLLEFLPSGTLKIPDLLDRSELDLAIGPHSALGERFSSRVLLRDEFVTVLHKNHPMAKQRGLSMKEFAKLPHLEISSARQLHRLRRPSAGAKQACASDRAARPVPVGRTRSRCFGHARRPPRAHCQRARAQCASDHSRAAVFVAGHRDHDDVAEMVRQPPGARLAPQCHFRREHGAAWGLD